MRGRGGGGGVRRTCALLFAYGGTRVCVRALGSAGGGQMGRGRTSARKNRSAAGDENKRKKGKLKRGADIRPTCSATRIINQRRFAG